MFDPYLSAMMAGTHLRELPRESEVDRLTHEAVPAEELDRFIHEALQADQPRRRPARRLALARALHQLAWRLESSARSAADATG